MRKTQWLVTLCLIIALGALNQMSAQIVVNEIMQNPSFVSDGDGEYFEIYNAGGSDVDIQGWTVRDDGSNSFTLPTGTPILVPAGGYFVFGVNDDTGTNGNVNVDYDWGSGSTFALGNGDDEVILEDSMGVEQDRVEYDGGPDWPDPTGASMELIDSGSDNNDFNNWTEAVAPWDGNDLGSPGAENTVSGVNLPPTISNTARDIQVPSSSDMVEISADMVDSDGTIASATLNYDTGTGFMSMAMANSGGDTYAASIAAQPNGTLVKYYVTATDDDGDSASDPSDAPTSFYTYRVNDSGTPANAIVNEVLYHNGAGEEFIEIYAGTGSSTIDMSYWQLKDDVNTFTMPEGTTVNAGDFIILAQDTAGFKTVYPGINNFVKDSYGFGYSSGGESLTLWDENQVEIDRVDYDNGAGGWPTVTAGFSIELVDTSADNNVGANWQVSADSLGNPNEHTVADTDPPGLASVVATSATTVDVQFDEAVEQSSAEDLFNYSIDNGIGNPVGATLDGVDLSLVHLTVGTMTSGTTYELTASSIEDLFGNVLGSESLNFTYTAPANPGDIIVTEIMQNPDSVSDASGEYFEVYNTTGSDIDMENMVISDNGSNDFTVSSSFVVPAGGFAVFTLNDDPGTNGGLDAPLMYDWGSSSTFTLSNSDDEVVIRDGSVTIDSVAYDGGPDWPDPTGVSMILTDFSTDNNDFVNWDTSTVREPHYTGSSGDLGSPGTLGTGQSTGAGTPMIVVQGTALSDFVNDTLTYYINEGPLGYDQPLTIRNTGDAELVWSITDEDSVGADCPNISVSPSDSSTAAGGTTSIIVTLDPVGLVTDNVYYCDMLIASNDPATPVYTVTVCINVISKWAEFHTEVQSIPPGQPIAPGDSIRDLFTFINNTGAEQTVRISTKWLRNTGQSQDQLSQRSPVLGRFEVNTNRNKTFAVPLTMPLDTNWVVSYIEHINGDTICTDTTAFEVVSAEAKAAMLGLAYGVGIPDRIALHRNYPNPFNPSTTIKYDLNEDTHVKIQVFNVLGQQVKTLVNGFEQAGYRQIVWDGTNNKGQSVASGIYIYRMEVAGFTQTYKMLLTK